MGKRGGVMGGLGIVGMLKLVGRTIGPAQPAFWRPESSPVAGCRFRETHVRILPSYMEAECTVSGTANCAGLSVPNFMLLTARRFRLKKSVPADPSCSACCCRR